MSSNLEQRCASDCWQICWFKLWMQIKEYTFFDWMIDTSLSYIALIWGYIFFQYLDLRAYDHNLDFIWLINLYDTTFIFWIFFKTVHNMNNRATGGLIWQLFNYLSSIDLQWFSKYQFCYQLRLPYTWSEIRLLSTDHGNEK